jgi:hypothetical protein
MTSIRILPLVAVALAGCGRSPPPAEAVAAPDPPPAATAPPPLDPGERVENPQYSRWAQAAVGTTVVLTERTSKDGQLVSTTMNVYKLVERTDTYLVVELSSPIIAQDGTKTVDPPVQLKHTRWMRKPAGNRADDLGRPEGTYATGEETVTVGGKAYKAKWYKYKGRVEAGETDSQLWLSDEVPGGIVRQEFRVPSIKRTISSELTAVKRPDQS